MRLTRLVGECDGGECPTIYRTDRGTLAFQGERITDHGIRVPEHEAMVEIPVELIRRTIRDKLI
ncbi:hypothetical protein [Streptomyces triculaminicus]|uniref:hypothetical protein n=1 Tax=Streptomyces triculaminicus TaxID=2816232 RepID=UPI0027DC26F8|nr:hypothetical protein [Streptomyces triculaminicus]